MVRFFRRHRFGILATTILGMLLSYGGLSSCISFRLAARLDALCTQRTCFASLNQALKRLHRNQAELLLVLERPELPRHNNLSEQDIRDKVSFDWEHALFDSPVLSTNDHFRKSSDLFWLRTQIYF